MQRERPLCEGIRHNGTRCTNRVARGHRKYCKIHSPTKAANKDSEDSSTSISSSEDTTTTTISSSDDSSSSSEDLHQCHGIRKDGTECTNRVAKGHRKYCKIHSPKKQTAKNADKKASKKREADLAGEQYRRGDSTLIIQEDHVARKRLQILK